MLRRTAAVFVFVGFTFAVQNAFAQTADALRASNETVSIAAAAASVNFSDDQAPVAPRREAAPKSGMSPWTPVLIGVHATTVTSQMLDAHSTLAALESGNGVEANPLMSGLTKNRAAFMAAKAGISAGLVYATHKMAGRNKIAAVAVATAVNGAYFYIANRNYKVARGER